VRLLLDTHVLIWALLNDHRLPVHIGEAIGDPNNDVVVSVASLWEIAIKRALVRGGPGTIPMSAVETVGFCGRAGYELLAVSPEHILGLEQLPAMHADPFDRILVAQALTEPLRLVTRDRRVAAYSDTVIVF
jgi:PIN domain nuclease of toxin-antitoxin system